jgi:PAS domain-containing protein
LSDKYEGEFTAEDEAVTVQLAQMASGAVEKARLHASLAKSEAYLAEGQRLSHMGSWAWNVSSGEFFWSQEHFRIFGLDPEKVKPSYPMLLQWIHPEDRSFLQESVERAIRDRRAYELDCRIVRPSHAALKHTSTAAHPVFNESATSFRACWYVIDTTERARRRALTERRRSWRMSRAC